MGVKKLPMDCATGELRNGVIDVFAIACLQYPAREATPDADPLVVHPPL